MPFRHALFCVALVSPVLAQQTPSPAAAPWWRETTALANDSMEGRDTGTEAYERAARYVADKFKAAGLRPAGDEGGYFQQVPMHETDLDVGNSSVEVVTPEGAEERLRLLEETTLIPRSNLHPLTEAPMVFAGYGLPAAGMDLRGKIVVYFNGLPATVTAAEQASYNGRRIALFGESQVAGVVSIDNPAATEPTHWPVAYARSVVLRPVKATAAGTNFVGLRISAEAAGKLFAGTNADFGKILADAEKGLPLPSMELKRGLRIRLRFTEKEIASPNILAVLPGSDATLAAEYVALSAHLDGYGYGTPVLGDRLYNGALDDAAYVATLLELARLQGALPPGQRPKRSLLFCIFTGEEKGLLGSAWFTAHPTVPIAQIVADLNLDQLRPIFPLKILTMEGITDSTLGETARTVAGRYGIELRPDREPERNLFRRADNYNFVRVGVPIGSFIFGYDRGTAEEVAYRDWYARRYHKPQDDVTTPIDWRAAVTFNDFYRDLALAVANAPDRPEWTATSAYRPTKAAPNAAP